MNNLKSQLSEEQFKNNEYLQNIILYFIKSKYNPIYQYKTSSKPDIFYLLLYFWKEITFVILFIIFFSSLITLNISFISTMLSLNLSFIAFYFFRVYKSLIVKSFKENNLNVVIIIYKFKIIKYYLDDKDSNFFVSNIILNNDFISQNILPEKEIKEMEESGELYIDHVFLQYIVDKITDQYINFLKNNIIPKNLKNEFENYQNQQKINRQKIK